MLNIIQSSYIKDNQLCKYFNKLKNAATSFKIEEVFQFISLNNLSLKFDQGPWGITYSTYPFSIAIDAKGDKEVIYHEFLHQLNVSDGYDSELNSCNISCWMQYLPVKGKLLCEMHKNELVNFCTKMELL